MGDNYGGSLASSAMSTNSWPIRRLPPLPLLPDAASQPYIFFFFVSTGSMVVSPSCRIRSAAPAGTLFQLHDSRTPVCRSRRYEDIVSITLSIRSGAAPQPLNRPRPSARQRLRSRLSNKSLASGRASERSPAARENSLRSRKDGQFVGHAGALIAPVAYSVCRIAAANCVFRWREGPVQAHSDRAHGESITRSHRANRATAFLDQFYNAWMPLQVVQALLLRPRVQGR